MTKLHDLSKLGQSIWFDFIRRSLITSGELQALVDKGVRGVTSNPTIFEKAIAGSADYDTDLNRLVGEGRSVDEIYETLANLNIRSGPGSHFGKLDASPLPKGTRLSLDSRSGPWCFVEVLDDGGVPDLNGWVHGDYIGPVA